MNDQLRQAEIELGHWRDYAQLLKRDVLLACLELVKERERRQNAEAFCAILERRLTEAGK